MKKTKVAQVLTKELKESLVHRIEPYVKAGLPINKACLQAGISRSTLYKIMEEDAYLRERVDKFKQFFSIATSSVIARKLHHILLKQEAGFDIVGEDLDFIKWLALHSAQCKDEFGKTSREIPDFDPEIEIRKINRLIDEKSNDISYGSVSN